MIVTICNGKGGAGKTTAAVLLVLALRRRGGAASLVDRDPQGTARRWMDVLGEPCADAAPGALMVVDTAPLITSPTLAESLAEADLAVLVSSASPADLWASQSTSQVARTHLRPAIPLRLLFNQVQRTTLLGRDLGALASRIGVPPLSSHLARRQAYQHAALLGWGALDRAAREEMFALAGEISTLCTPSP